MGTTARIQGRAIRPQITIGQLMITVAVCAILLAMTGSALGAATMAALVALYVHVFRLVWLPPSLPQRRR
jgi:hypothetical protein